MKAQKASRLLQKTCFMMLKEQHRYFSIESAMGQDYANAAERSHSILKRLADIFGDE